MLPYSLLRCISTWSILLQLVHSVAVPNWNNETAHPHCKSIPGDTAWPNLRSWAQLNDTVKGRLSATVPLGHVCHAPNFDEEKCKQLQKQWGLASLVVPQPGEFMATWFQNNTCTPFGDPNTQCDLGNYASYSIDVRSAGDVQAGLAFAKDHNVRLTIKNSGHDFFGKSTGKGALSLWVHNLNSKSIIRSYNSTYYTGPAAKIGSGVQGGEAASFASAHGYRLVVGSCPTVKAAGGFTQGGGHSFLSGMYGFGADNVLEWEVITASGEYLIATPTQNTDLYFALSGGGGGTYAVVLSMTSRLFPDGDIAIATMSFGVNTWGGVDAYWDAIAVYHEQLQPLIDQGMVAEYMITNTSLHLYGMMAPGYTKSTLRSAMSPMLSALSTNASSNLTADTISLEIHQSQSYHELYAAIIEPLMVGNIFAPAVAGRFIPRKLIESDSVNIHRALRNAIADGRYFLSNTALNAMNPHRQSTAPAVSRNALQPNFNTAFSSVIITPSWDPYLPWSEAQVLQDELADVVMPGIEQATPDAGAYKNEASWSQKDFQEAFYGGLYGELGQIKNKYDPDGIFYGLTTVGSERWMEDGDGRLCETPPRGW